MHRSMQLPFLATAVVLALAACDGTPDAAPGSAGSPPAACGGVGEQVKNRLARPGVEGVTVDAQCATVLIATTLSDGDGGTAAQLCNLAAEVAYSGKVTAIRVLGQSKKELAQGAKGAACQSNG